MERDWAEAARARHGGVNGGEPVEARVTTDLSFFFKMSEASLDLGRSSLDGRKTQTCTFFCPMPHIVIYTSTWR